MKLIITFNWVNVCDIFFPKLRYQFFDDTWEVLFFNGSSTCLVIGSDSFSEDTDPFKERMFMALAGKL